MTVSASVPAHLLLLLLPVLSASNRALMASNREDVLEALAPRVEEGAETVWGTSWPGCLAA